jgi:hypothetical protein
LPPTHTATPFAGTGQAFPQPPQLAGLVVVSTQALPQAVIPALHDALHSPDEHTSSVAHTPSHEPQ